MPRGAAAARLFLISSAFLPVAWACADRDRDPGDRGQTAGLFAPEPEVHRGTVFEGALLEHEFELEVRGSSPVRLLAVEADCGCTAAELVRLEGGARVPVSEGAVLEPGARLVLRASYDTRGRLGEAWRGVRVRAERAGPLELRIGADVRPWLIVEDDAGARLDRLDLGTLRAGAAVELGFAVRAAGGEPFHLAFSGEGVPPQVEVRLQPRGDELGRARSWSGTISVGAGIPEGRRAWALRLVTDVANPDDELGRPVEATLVLEANLVAEVSAEPRVLNLGILHPGEISAGTVRVRSHDPAFGMPEPVARLLPLAAAGDGENASEPGGRSWVESARISARAVPGENAWDVQILFEDPSPVSTGGGHGGPGGRRLLGTLIVETGHPAKPEIEVQVLGVLAAPLTGERSPGPPGAAAVAAPLQPD